MEGGTPPPFPINESLASWHPSAHVVPMGDAGRAPEAGGAEAPLFTADRQVAVDISRMYRDSYHANLLTTSKESHDRLDEGLARLNRELEKMMVRAQKDEEEYRFMQGEVKERIASESRLSKREEKLDRKLIELRAKMDEYQTDIKRNEEMVTHAITRIGNVALVLRSSLFDSFKEKPAVEYFAAMFACLPGIAKADIAALTKNQSESISHAIDAMLNSIVERKRIQLNDTQVDALNHYINRTALAAAVTYEDRGLFSRVMCNSMIEEDDNNPPGTFPTYAVKLSSFDGENDDVFHLSVQFPTFLDMPCMIGDGAEDTLFDAIRKVETLTSEA